MVEGEIIYTNIVTNKDNISVLSSSLKKKTKIFWVGREVSFRFNSALYQDLFRN